MKKHKHQWKFVMMEESLDTDLWAYFVCHGCQHFKKEVYTEVEEELK